MCVSLYMRVDETPAHDCLEQILPHGQYLALADSRAVILDRLGHTVGLFAPANQRECVRSARWIRMLTPWPSSALSWSRTAVRARKHSGKSYQTRPGRRVIIARRMTS